MNAEAPLNWKLGQSDLSIDVNSRRDRNRNGFIALWRVVDTIKKGSVQYSVRYTVVDLAVEQL